jgi:uncharacterized protein YndB with AHSA1/START domain
MLDIAVSFGENRFMGMKPLMYAMDIPAGRDPVFEAWTTAEGLLGWAAREAFVEPRVGGRYELLFDPASRDLGLFGRIWTLDPPRLLYVGSDENSQRFELELSLFPTLDGTRMEITHRLRGTGPHAAARVRLDNLWMNGLEKLRTVLPRRQPEE